MSTSNLCFESKMRENFHPAYLGLLYKSRVKGVFIARTCLHDVCMKSITGIDFFPGTDGSSVEHPAGNHAYPFAFQLQESVPSSFEGSRGYVRYFCKATIDRPWKFDSHDLRAFTVIHHFDLNRFPNAIVSTSHPLYNTIGIKYVFIPPAKRSFRGVYCFQPVRHSVIPSFRHSVIP